MSEESLTLWPARSRDTHVHGQKTRTPHHCLTINLAHSINDYWAISCLNRFPHSLSEARAAACHPVQLARTNRQLALPLVKSRPGLLAASPQLPPIPLGHELFSGHFCMNTALV